MAGIVLGSGIEQTTKKAKVPALMEHTVGERRQTTNIQINKMIPKGDHALEIK